MKTKKGEFCLKYIQGFRDKRFADHSHFQDFILFLKIVNVDEALITAGVRDHTTEDL